jgi:hypothetical protein
MDAPVRERRLEVLCGRDGLVYATHGVRRCAKLQRHARLNLPRQTVPGALFRARCKRDQTRGMRHRFLEFALDERKVRESPFER